MTGDQKLHCVTLAPIALAELRPRSTRTLCSNVRQRLIACGWWRREAAPPLAFSNQGHAKRCSHFPPVESVRIRDPCPFRAGVGESTQKIDRSDSFVEMIRLSASLDGHAAMESERTGFGGAKSVNEKEKVQSGAPRASRSIMEPYKQET
ncbi:unnamed protein product [Chrysodeixis includens]|uniref:Uncharacterized protein n=1 Tax=Chrysodeixis includens TaxID=689277 RepID=A0A9N8PZE5_CHRIL|nr:unnamed protein product [Chrysodeixis includens]